MIGMEYIRNVIENLKLELIFFRCDLCTKVVSEWDIREVGACTKCGGARVRPTNLSLMEEIIQIIKHPKVWKWKDLKQETGLE